jgi:phosphoglycerate dehydrogenase-like enzyme
MVGTLGIMMVCLSALAEHCDVLTSPHIFSSEEECQASTVAEARKIMDMYSHAVIKPNCVALRYNGEPT